MSSGSLYIVATPIGNLEDITLRALRILQEVSCIACEDTRHSMKLLSSHGITGKRLISYHSHSGLMKEEKIFELLEAGNDVALISDCGTPGISDPGSLLAAKAVERGIPVVPIPGPTAFVAALSGCGFPTHHFEFFGFLPHKKGRQTLMKKIAHSENTVILYESTHRIEKFLDEAAEHFPERRIVLARELTKIHEEYLRGRAEDIMMMFKTTPEKKKGEFVVLISGEKDLS